MASWRSVTMLALAAVAVAALVLLAEPAAAAEVEVTLVGATPGAAQDVAVAGDYAYVAATSGLLVVDISNASAPVREAFLPLPGEAWDVAVMGNYTYVADGSGGLVVVDVSDPTDPNRVGGYDTTGYASGVTVVGYYAYVAASWEGLVVVDVSDPTDPTYAGGYYTAGSAAGVAVAGDYAYVADWGNGLVVVDVSDPTDPTRVGGYDTSGWAYGVAVAGDYAYVADGATYGLVVIDVSDPTDPTRVSDYYTAGNAVDVAVTGDYAYVADWQNGLVVIDVSDPADPTRVGSYDTAGRAYGVAVAGSYAYVTDRDGGLVVVDVSDPTDPTGVGSYDTTGTARGVAVAGDYAYVADWHGGLVVVDVSDPTDLTRIGGYDTSGTAWGLAVVGDHAYVADASGLVVVNVSDPADPVRAGGYDTAGSAWGLAVEGNYAYIAAGGEGLVVVDVSDPTDPTRVGGYDTTGTARGVAVAGDYAYVADDDNGLVVVNISDPANPTRAGGYDTAGSAWGLAVEGNYAYVAAGGEGLVVVDVSDPTNPTRVGGYDATGTARGVAVAGDYAYVAIYSGGLVGVDVSDPSDPTRIGGYDTAGRAYGVAVAGGYIYVADDSGGLQILYFSLSATIDSISPNPANEGNTVAFIGSGFDPNGTIVGYQWRSSLDGDLSTNASFNASSLSIGIHTIYFKVQAEDGNWSEDVNRTLKINSFPIAIIDFIAPSPANQEDEVTFEGRGTDNDGSIAGYHWLSDIDGQLSIADNFDTSILTPGTHTISFRVRDNDGAWSEWDTLSLHINALPIANIDSILPSPANEGDEITFNGSSLDFDGTITGYQWRSDRDGNLSNTVNFTTTNISPGNHNISFRVHDNDDVWSPWDTISLNVNVLPIANIDSISPSPANEGDEVIFNSSSLDLDGNVTSYQWNSSLDGNLSTAANFTTSLTFGNHTVSFRVQDNDGAWSSWVNTTLHVNARPTLSNGSVTPATGGESTTFTFSVDYDDLNAGQTNMVRVTIAGLGTFGMADPNDDGTFLYETTLPWGYRNFSFSATDDYDASATGDTAPHELRVNAWPTAVIDASAPTNATFGEEVTFSGSASDPDGTIAAWEWRSDRDGLLGTTATLTLGNLSVGTHNLTFRVQDDSDAWSEPATATLTVQARPTQDEAAGPLGLAPLAWAALGGVVLLAGGGAGAYFWRRQVPPAPGSEGAPLAPAAPLANIACPGCQAQMAVPKLGRLQSVKCASCGLVGEIEV